MTGFFLECADCRGDMDDKKISVRVALKKYRDALFCKECGRIHFTDGHAVFNQSGRPAFYIDGQVVIK